MCARACGCGSGSVRLISWDRRIFAVHFNWKLVQVPRSLLTILTANTDDLHRWVRIISHKGGVGGGQKKKEDYVLSCFGTAAKSCLCKVLPTDVWKHSPHGETLTSPSASLSGGSWGWTARSGRTDRRLGFSLGL